MLLEDNDRAALFVAECFSAGVIEAFAKIIFSLERLAESCVNEETLHILRLLVHTVGLDLLNENERMIYCEPETLHASFLGFLYHYLLLLGGVSLWDVCDRNRHMISPL